MEILTKKFYALLFILTLIFIGTAVFVHGQTAPLYVYQDSSLNSPWMDVSYASSRVINSTEQAYAGTTSIKVINGIWGAFRARNGNWGVHNNILSSQYSFFSVAVYGGTQGAALQFKFENDAGDSFPGYTASAPANIWTLFNIPMSTLDPENHPINSFYITETSGQPRTFYLDEIQFVPAGSSAPSGTVPPVVSNPPPVDNTNSGSTPPVSSGTTSGGSSSSSSGMWLVGYYPDWWWGTLDPENIDWTGMTHMVLFTGGGVITSAPYFSSSGLDFKDSSGRSYLSRTIAAAHSHNVKVLLSVASVYPGTNLNAISSDPAKIDMLVQQSSAYAQANGFDGIEIDWEWPNVKSEHSYLLNDYRTELNKWPTRGILVESLDMATFHNAYDPLVMNADLDQMYAMTYTMWVNCGGPVAGYGTPVYKSTQYLGLAGCTLNDNAISFITGGYDVSKMAISISFESIKFGGATKPGDKYTSWAYVQARNDMRNDPSAVFQWDSSAEASWALWNNYLYDVQTPQSVSAIMQWVKQKNFGGFMIYDFPAGWLPNKSTLQTSNPLWEAVAQSVGNTTVVVASPPATDTTPPSSTTTTPPSTSTSTTNTGNNSGSNTNSSTTTTGGGGGGSGGGYYPPATTTTSLSTKTTIPGCDNRTTGFSTTTGVSCAGNAGTGVTATYNFGTVTLKNGSRGAAVMELQRFLNDKLSLGLAVDGKLGPKTIAVIKKWQKAQGLVADGLVGAKTKIKMNAE